jgi:hypothetical protein
VERHSASPQRVFFFANNLFASVAALPPAVFFHSEMFFFENAIFLVNNPFASVVALPPAVFFPINVLI